MLKAVKKPIVQAIIEDTTVVIKSTIPGIWPEPIKRALVEKKFSAKKVTFSGITHVLIDGDVFRRELKKQDPTLHRQLLLHDPKVEGIPTLFFRPSWVEDLSEKSIQ